MRVFTVFLLTLLVLTACAAPTATTPIPAEPTIAPTTVPAHGTLEFKRIGRVGRI